MKEIRNILAEYDKVKDSHEVVLATVVKVRGSSYRSPGARMLIRKDGRWTGSISGGCLEGDALRKARKVMASKETKLVTYDTMDDANNSLGVGLGCNGIIDVLLQPISVSENPIERLRSMVGIEDLTVIATVFRSDLSEISIGEQIWLNADEQPEGKINNEVLLQQVRDEMQQVFEDRKPAIKSLMDDKVEVFFEIIEPSIDLQIFGGGFDAKPVVEIAKTLGWNVTVSDECIVHIAPANFPQADQVALCKRDEHTDQINVKPYTAAILMSHSYEYDLAILRKLLKTSVRYIGILGPKKRTDKMYDQLEKEGVSLSAEDKHRIHSPVGLDIGAETPEEIALSIITEIQASFTNRSGGFLKYRKAPIHHRDGKKDQVFKQVFINKPTEQQKTSQGQ